MVSAKVALPENRLPSISSGPRASPTSTARSATEVRAVSQSTTKSAVGRKPTSSADAATTARRNESVIGLPKFTKPTPGDSGPYAPSSAGQKTARPTGNTGGNGRDYPQSVEYPADLPITAHRDEILAALVRHQVLIVAGETGSGKSTQLPKILLELDPDGWIGHTQPRRIAARSVAERVAEEIGTSIGGLVGYTVRFNDQVGSDTRIKVMTDGILLAEIQRDPELRRYEALIIDEAHERSLNIDFLLGYLKRLLPRRPELKLIITSATIDTERFAEHFATAGVPAPVIEVSGRTYPVELRYRPLDTETDQIDGIVKAVQELSREGPGDILVFLPGERDIRDAADALGDLQLSNTEIVPLYARLSAAEQHRIFASHRGRRIVLATNIAETSLTVPGIRFVIDPGTARISRYNQRTKVQRLPIEDVSQASANQRAGRCGRLGPGICIRLYSEEDFDGRDEFTDPEITRTNLASVILQMVSLGIAPEGVKDIQDFPFVEAPDTRTIADGVRLLEELGALDPEPDEKFSWLTPRGARLARLPLDPRIARMVIAGDELGVLDPVLVIGAALSIQDPRESPSDNREAARQSHARFNDPKSDFVTLLFLWDYVNTERRQRSSGSFRRMCRREFLNHNRIREWQDLYAQLKRVSKDLELQKPQRRRAEDVDADGLHRALLTGLLSQVGVKDERELAKSQKQGRTKRQKPLVEYIGARNARFVIAPGSVLSKSGPRWVMAGELTETNRLYARMVAPIQPSWLEEAGGHMASYSYADPEWSEERGTAVVVERAALFGLPIVPGRQINLYRVDVPLARELFIQHALVGREWDVPDGSGLHQFLNHNAAVIAEAARWEAKTRNRDLEVEASLLFSHYDRALPPTIVSVRHFEKWWKTKITTEPELLNLRVADVLPAALDPGAFPDTWPGSSYRIGYTFDPGSPVDGITVSIPFEELSKVEGAEFSWLVPGYRLELVTELLRTLPKDTRTRLIPLPDTAAEVVAALPAFRSAPVEPIEAAVRRELKVDGVMIERGLLQPEYLPAHLRPTFQVLSPDGTMLAAGRDLERLKDRLRDRVRAELGNEPHPLERTGLTAWPGGDLPQTANSTQLGVTIEVYPALADRTDGVDLVVLASKREQAQSHWNGVRRLLRLSLTRPVRHAVQLLDSEVALAIVGLSGSEHLQLSKAALVDDLVNAALDTVIASAGGPPWTEHAMNALIRFSARRFPESLETVATDGGRVLLQGARCQSLLDRLVESPVDLDVIIHDCRRQLRSLLFPGSFSAQGAHRLPAVARYLAALAHRLEQLPNNRHSDLEHLATVLRLETAATNSDDAEVMWMVQELRVSLWAQHLGTDGPISPQRIRKRLAKVR
ncbi:MAG: ATP-dependent RNA helicase HrpA [Acidimicrobiales bacterium]|nr:ATP-dependent RNA helicase HrpA [Acidimicrobiales bacterium]